LNVQVREEAVAQLASPALVAYSFEGSPASSGTVAQLPRDTHRVLEELQNAGELTGKTYECTIVHRPAGLAASRLLVIGAGKRESFGHMQLRRLASAAIRHLRSRGVREVAWILEGSPVEPAAVQAVVEGAILGDYDAERYRTSPESSKSIERLDLACAGASLSAAELAAIERGQIVAQAQNLTRDLVNEPPNRMTPTLLAQRAQELAVECGLQCEVLGPQEIERLKMGAFLAVAQGSEEPLRLIVLRYWPPEAAEEPVVGLVGKGITFDTGGISIKPSENLHEMKTDMAGAATMLGVMQAVARLKPPLRVLAVLPATENMPSGRAYRPGDVLTSMSGKTIEVLNTDAEGRLILADALTYARQLGCSVLIDAATLTGAVQVALGQITTGVFGWDQVWVQRVLRSAAAAGEKAWQLPLDEDYRELYKSTIADLANTGGRYGGAITAAMFLGEFVGSSPWVHLDIAGTRWSSEDKPYQSKGPTGAMVRTLVHLLTHLSEEDRSPAEERRE